ncbi:MAG: insulinase family protein [Saprospiraceae bacterium]|nr:insulinase family protein [Saprospiraceae bacterium]
MKKLFLYTFLSLFCVASLMAQDFRKSAPKPGKAKRIQLGQAEEFTLKNGLQVIVVENNKLPRVSFQVFVDVPVRKEGDIVGVSSMAGQLLNKGTKTRTKAQIDEAVDFIGASLSSNANGLFASSLSRHKDDLLTIMTDVLFNPVFPEAEFEKLKKQTLSGLAQQKDDPSAIASNVANVLRYGIDHPYGEIQTEENVNNISLESAKKYYNTYFKPNISYLVIVGDISVKEAKMAAEKYFGKWQRGVVAEEKFEEPEKPGSRQVSFVNRAGAVQSVINITCPIELKTGSPDVVKTTLLNNILGSGFNGRLFANLREDKGFTYGAYSSMSSDPLVGYFNASASVRNEVTDSAIVEFLYEIDRIAEEKISDEEVQLSKNFITGSFARSLERPQTIANFALSTARFDLPKDYYATYLERLNAITPADLQAVAKKYIDDEDMHILVVGNKGEVAEKLEQFDADGTITFRDAFGKVIKDEDNALPEGVSAATIVEDYINAIGGRDAMKKVEDMTIVMSTTVMGQTMQMETMTKAPNKMKMTAKMSGMVMNETKFDGQKAKISQMGQNVPVDENTNKEMRQQARMFPERTYLSDGYKLELSGIETINGKKAYAVVVTTPSGSKTTEYYDMATSLKIRTVMTQSGPQGEVTVTNDFSDYREVEGFGIKIPYQTTSTGMAPVPITLKTESVKINTGLEDSVFEVK